MLHHADLSVSDARLVEQLRGGDEIAFQQVYQRYWYKLYMTAKRKALSDADAEELVQDIFIDLWQRRSNLEIIHLKNYLVRAVKYKVINSYKSQLVRQQHQRFVMDSADAAENNTDSELALQDLMQAIKVSAEKLPEKTQEIFRLNRLEDKSVREVSKILGIPERTVEYHVTQSLKVMRRYLKDFLVGLTILSDFI